MIFLATPRGDARLYVDEPPGRARATVLLVHGAGGGANAAVLLAVRDALLAATCRVARLDQPYVVAGRRAPDPAPRLDEVALLAAAGLPRPLVLGGKSSGARVACRTAAAAGAAGVVALGFPLHPPGRPEKSRLAELEGAGVPVLVVQGERDTFGTPEEFPPGTELHVVAGGDHSFVPRKADGRTAAECLREVAGVAAGWVLSRR